MKRFLKTLGLAVLIVIGLFGVLLGPVIYRGITSADDNKAAAILAVEALARDWSPRGKGEILHETFVEAATTAEGSRALQSASRLGPFLAASNVSQRHVRVSTGDGMTAVIVFDAAFRNGTSNLTVTLVEAEDGMRASKITFGAVEFRTPKDQQA